MKIDPNADAFSTKETITDIKTLIVKYIDRSPGIRYGELLKLSRLTNGALEYHLRILEKRNKVKVDRHDGRRARFYPIDILAHESHMLGYLRNATTREIVVFVLEHNLCTFREILEHMKKAPSTLSWHIKRLSEEAEIISVTQGTEFRLYQVINREMVTSVLNKYNESFRDKIASQYYEMFGEL
jgi:predicted transcriptional regulator